MRAAVAVMFLSFVAVGSAKAACGKRTLEGVFEPIGSAFWTVAVNFGTGEAVHASPDGARVVRRVGAQACGSNQIAFTLVRGTPLGAPDLDCRGAIAGNTVNGRCTASGGDPQVRFSGTLRAVR